MATKRGFDFIVCGAGSSGAVIASRLAQHFRVCLVEAGGESQKNPFVQIPLMVGFLVSFNRFSNWNYNTIPQKHLNGRKIFWPRGKMVGGSSAMNGMVYQRGNASDYDAWAKQGNSGWSYKEMLPYFKRLESWEPPVGLESDSKAAEYHGTDGPISCSNVPSPNPLARVFVEAGQQAGLPLNRDFNGASQEGVGLNQWSAQGGLRCSTARNYLSDEVRRNGNLTVMTRSKVSRLLTHESQPTKVVGIQLVGGKEVHADREVILCGGAVNSPQTLMLSGIGPSEELAKHGIATLRHTPGVGKNLQDHLNLPVTCRESTSLSYGVSPFSLHRWILSPLHLAQGRGMLTSTFAEGGGFTSTAGDSAWPDVQFHFYPSKIKRNMSLSSILGHGFGLQTCLLRPRSRGHVELQSADPEQAPLIDPNYFSDAEDLEVMVKGLKIARKVLACDAFKPHLREEIEPGEHVQSDDDIREYIRNTITTIFHPAGTCKMGPDSDPMAVVDDRLRVHGMEGLRVADCSIMPDIVSANTNVPAIAIGEKAADMITEDQDLGVRL